MITDRIFVIHGGKIEETGTHEELMQTDGIYSRMFNAQKQWYKKNGEEAVVNA
jgi:ABC-type multidrug transport system fused ATPase/permease subunit